MSWHRFFEAQVDQRPEALAVVAGERCLTYAELDGRANHLAARLIALGAGAESVVGVHCGRSVELVVAMLAVLKAGSAYLPLDPDYPGDRLRFMLDDSGAQILVTRQVLADHLPAGGREVVRIGDQEGDDAAAWRQAQRPAGRVEAGHLAYVIYTSGSTGQPKGTLLEHRGLSATALAQRAVLRPEPTDRILQFSSPSFDASIFEIVLALGNGAALHIVAAGELSTGPPLTQILRRNEITMAVLTPTVLAATEPGSLPHLRLMISAGEPCSAEIVNRWAPGRRFVNAYGPTEATIWASFADCHPGAGAPPLGGQLPGGQLYVLDAGLRPAAAGQVGELCIGGAAVARGYLGRPALTAERFVADPFSGVPGARLYRTGDLVRRRGGKVEFVGRADRQVKVRGFRVELGEIESQLLAAPGVRQAVVTPHRGPGSAGDVRLVAYVAADPVARNEDLLAGLAGDLPAHMVPSYIVRLPELPLDPNGKIDRARLPEPVPEHGARPPSTPTEEVVAGIWRQILGLPVVGAEADFFALGGHSVLTVRVATAIHETLGVLLSPAALFEHRTIAAVARLIDDRAGPQEADGPVRRTDGQPASPLSFAQQQVWFLNSIAPDNRSYSAHALLRMRGGLDDSALARCLRRIVARHEILRTTFVEREWGPVQEVHPEGVVALPTVDLRRKPDPEHELKLHVDEEIRRPFDPGQLPLARWTLYRLEDGYWALLHSEHHFVHDGWSFAVFLGELIELYRADREGRPASLPDLTIQFADFAEWQRRWVRGAEAASQLDYWRDVLRDSPSLLELPADRPRPLVQSFRGDALRRPLPPRLVESLATLAQTESTTLFVIFVAALNALLHRCGGGEDIVIGSPFANRRWPQTEHLIGMVINTVPLRVDLSGDPTFRELAGRVRKVVLGAYANQDLPFERMVQELRPQRSLSHNPLFQVLCGFHDTPLPAFSLPGVELEVQEALHNGSAKFDLNLTVIPRRDHPTAIWEYSTDLFDQETVESLAERHERLLAAVAADPGRRLSELPLMSDEERRRMLVDWNRTERPVEPACLHALVARQAAHTPNAVAVRAGDRQLTYSDLQRRSDAVTAALLAAGIGPEARVAVCARRSPDMLAALLGVLAAGAAYVPIDPDYPPRRIAFMLADAGIEVTLADREAAAALPDHGASVLVLEDITDARTFDLPRPTADNLAYVIYTSGSTGTPKGVAVTHGALVNLLEATAGLSGIGPGDVLAAVTSLSFDIAALELFMPLLVGATVVIHDRATTRDPIRLANRNRVHGVTIMQATPSTWQALIASGWAGDPGLTALCGGEAMNSALAEALRSRTRVLWNVYGPTETTIWSSAAQVGNGQVTIGRPLANTRLYVLDRALRPVPAGVTGELYIGGVGLARGYLGRPDLTAERFVPDPFRSGERLYRTGDLVCYRRDGEIDFRGRTDDQVKIRGFRIEPGEIEAVLGSLPGVSAATVVVRSERLVAYVATVDGQRPAGMEGWLRERLPEHLLPAAVVALDRLPLTPNGKLDRRALPDPDPPARAIPPASERERRIAAIWRSVLGASEVGVEDNFFDVGGHSLLLVGVQRQFREEFGVDVPLLALLQYPTVRTQAAHVGGERRDDDGLTQRRRRGEARRRLLSGER